jgi:hypothetical protein
MHSSAETPPILHRADRCCEYSQGADADADAAEDAAAMRESTTAADEPEPEADGAATATAVAKFDFEAEADDELSFVKGDEILMQARVTVAHNLTFHATTLPRSWLGSRVTCTLAFRTTTRKSGASASTPRQARTAYSLL